MHLYSAAPKVEHMLLDGSGVGKVRMIRRAAGDSHLQPLALIERARGVGQVLEFLQGRGGARVCLGGAGLVLGVQGLTL